MSWHHIDLPTGDFFEPDLNVPMASHVFETQGTQHVFYLQPGVPNTIFEIRWGGGSTHVRDLLDGSTAARPSDGTNVASLVFEAEGTQHVFYVSAGQSDDRHIWELWWTGGEKPHSGDLTLEAAAPLVKPHLQTVTSHVVKSEGTLHVFYVSEQEHVVELWWQGSAAAQARDLTPAGSGAPPPTSRPASHVVEAEDTQHVFYNAAGHIIELSWRGGDVPHPRDLTPTGGRAPLAAGRPISHVFAAEGTQHVFYTTVDLHIIELWWRFGEEPHVEDLTLQSGEVEPPPFPLSGPLQWGDLASHVFDAEGTQHIFYTAKNQHIIELWWQGGGARHPEDLTLRSGGARRAVGSPISHVFAGEATQHVFYGSANDPAQVSADTITELWFRP